ncbi:MAG: adenine phosphoribosyltransferase [Omnitrophica WOR_2 bacterium RIFCSPHIGHO2_02_FULL_45_21]|nr:MAG: adenine phosphoribosyltransferase [Omnitrophica WOR_2 bacterium RIFCSPHIGHO2_02_FULL_45_21]
MDLARSIRSIPDFPKPGILFRDITTLLKNQKAFTRAVDLIAGKFSKSKIDYVVGVEARGFIFGGALAQKLHLGFIPVRKKGKLPGRTKGISYNLEYGTDSLEIHEDALKPKDKVLIIDDLLATGGTVKAVADLLEAQGAKIIGIAFVIELVDLKGREKLKKYPIVSLVKFEGE